MRKYFNALVFAMALVFYMSTGLPAIATDFSDLYERNVEGTFVIYTEYQMPTPMPSSPIENASSLGTAWLLDENLFVTADHVVAIDPGAKKTLEGIAGNDKPSKLWDIEILYRDKERDIAFFRLKDYDAFVKAEHPFILPLVENTKLRNGQEVFAIGNREGYFNNFYSAHISKAIWWLDISPGSVVAMTDTPTIPGDSGGPVFNTAGEVVGMADANLTFESQAQNGMFIIVDLIKLALADYKSHVNVPVDKIHVSQRFDYNKLKMEWNDKQESFVESVDPTNDFLTNVLGLETGDTKIVLSSPWTKNHFNVDFAIDTSIDVLIFANTLGKGDVITIDLQRANGKKVSKTITFEG